MHTKSISNTTPKLQMQCRATKLVLLRFDIREYGTRLRYESSAHARRQPHQFRDSRLLQSDLAGAVLHGPRPLPARFR